MKLDFLRLTNVRTDPIINPNGLSSHVHSFFGAARAAPNTTYEDLRSSTGNTGNVEENKSLYWHPTIYRFDKATEKYFISPTSQFSTYYIWKTGEVRAFPDGFKMIGGGAPDVSLMMQRAECVGQGACPNGDCETRNDFFPATECAELEMSMRMPNCWDGVNLDSADHRSHVAYSEGSDPQGACPSTHPVQLPQVRYFTRIMPYPGGIHMFSDGSGLFHADYFSGWQASFLQKVLDECENNSFEAMPTSWCENHMTFRDAPKDASTNETNIAKLESLQPNPAFDPSFITTEFIDGVSCLPSNECTNQNGVTTTTVPSPTTNPNYACCVDSPCPNDLDSCWLAYEQNCGGYHDEVYPGCLSTSTTAAPTTTTSTTTTTTTTVAPTTTETPATTVAPGTFANSPVRSDNTIRPFYDQTKCFFHKMNGFTLNELIYIGDCVNHDRYRWDYNETSGQLTNWNRKWIVPHCIEIPDHQNAKKKQQLFLAPCDAAKPAQSWVVMNGMLRLRQSPTICAMWNLLDKTRLWGLPCGEHLFAPMG
jgi:hypothetical protein